MTDTLRMDLGGAVRASVILAGLATTTAGYLYGRIALTRGVALCPADCFALTADLSAQRVDVLCSSGRVPLTAREVARPSCLRSASRSRRTTVSTTRPRPSPGSANVDSGRPSMSRRAGSTDPADLRPDSSASWPLPGRPSRSASTLSPTLAWTSWTPAAYGSSSPAERRRFRTCSARASETSSTHTAATSGARALVFEAGFSPAAAVKNAVSHAGDDQWAGARYTITNATSPALLARRLQGRGARYAWRRMRVHTRAYRAFRRARWGIARERSA